MNIAFISYWGLNEGLTQATVLPHLEILKKLSSDINVTLFTFERNNDNLKIDSEFQFKIIQVSVSGLKSHFQVWRKFKKIHLQKKFDYIICRSSLAGIIGFWAKKKLNIPFCVESFEPHTDYMIEAGEWKKNSVKARILRYYEKKQKLYADYILPVAQNYKERLLQEGIPAKKILVMPCAVDIEKFKFNSQERTIIRDKLGINPSAVCGIYIGKFGGIYYDQKAFEIFKHCQSIFESFFLLLLSPESRHQIEKKMTAIGFTTDMYYHSCVPFQEVPKYLSAADFAFSLHSSSPSKKYLSPIKNGEYWANGLPIVMSENIGDDVDIIDNNQIGVIFNSEQFEENLSKLPAMLKDPVGKSRKITIPDFAKRYRSFDIVHDQYTIIIDNIIGNT